MSSDHGNASADDHGSTHSHDHGHDDHASVDAIPESSPQDLILKVVTLAAAVVLFGTGVWWAGVPLANVHEATHESSNGQAPSEGAAEHAPAH